MEAANSATGHGTGRVDKVPDHYSDTNWPKGLRLKILDVDLLRGSAEAINVNGETLKPVIPLDQLAKFLDDHVEGEMQEIWFMGSNDIEDAVQRLLKKVTLLGRLHKGMLDGVVQRLLDEVIVPGRLHTGVLHFTDFFHLPWAGIKRILDGRSMSARVIQFLRLQLPEGVDANELIKLPAVRGCTTLNLVLHGYRLPELPSSVPTPHFDDASLVEWLKRSDDRLLELASNYLSSGLPGFLGALKKDFRQATQTHSYQVKIHCPGINVAGLGVQNELLHNAHGEKMEIKVGEDPGMALMMGREFQTVSVERLPLS